ncbi:unnamed protein product [Rotaria sordida]|uniref:F-box domain-containing protein n=1 Tax=Rotaria sordida TaxID=392033 RepID=A0A815KKJ3_9BILA|nr:unnamed protein product [Rotaria sordida]CAF1397490.1 unnamed protein product [Rotaria sordida]
MNCLPRYVVHLLDLSDELILAIMNQVKPHVLLLCSIVSIGNNRLEQLALDKCQSIDLTFDYLQSLHESLFQRFYSHVLPRIFNNIQSLTLHIQHLHNILTFIEKNSDKSFPNFTHLRIMPCKRNPKTGTPYTLDCICLLKQLGQQLDSFIVSIVYVDGTELRLMFKISSILCPNLKHLSMTIYRNFDDYKKCFVPLLQRLSNVKFLTLLLAIGETGKTPNHFIDGYDLENDIIAYMPHLCQFNFHIRSILENAPHVELDTIRQSFFRQQSVNCAVNYFNNNYGQCQIYSLPFIGTRLDFIFNRFPLFDITNTFCMVTTLLLFDDIEPFESIFFERLAQALPHLRTLEIINKREQKDKIRTTTNNLKFSHLTTLILFDIHMNYVEQLLSRTYLPSLNELAICNDILLAIINQNQHQTRDNCSRVERLQTSEPLYNSVNVVQNYFPSDSYLKQLVEKQ